MFDSEVLIYIVIFVCFSLVLGQLSNQRDRIAELERKILELHGFVLHLLPDEE